MFWGGPRKENKSGNTVGTFCRQPIEGSPASSWLSILCCRCWELQPLLLSLEDYYYYYQVACHLWTPFCIHWFRTHQEDWVKNDVQAESPSSRNVKEKKRTILSFHYLCGEHAYFDTTYLSFFFPCPNLDNLFHFYLGFLPDKNRYLVELTINCLQRSIWAVLSIVFTSSC